MCDIWGHLKLKQFVKDLKSTTFCSSEVPTLYRLPWCSHTPLFALPEIWFVQVQLPLFPNLLEAIVDDFCLDLPGLGTVKPINNVRVAIFDVIFGIEELSGSIQPTCALLQGRLAFSLIHTVLKRL